MMGKPEAAIYDACARALGVPKARIVAVGDSLAHDILGANAAGVDSVFVASGIHVDDLVRSPPTCRLGRNGPFRY